MLIICVPEKIICILLFFACFSSFVLIAMLSFLPMVLFLLCLLFLQFFLKTVSVLKKNKCNRSYLSFRVISGIPERCYHSHYLFKDLKTLLKKRINYSVIISLGKLLKPLKEMNWETIRNNPASFNIAVIVSGRDSPQRLLEFLVDIAARVYYFKSKCIQLLLLYN